MLGLLGIRPVDNSMLLLLLLLLLFPLLLRMLIDELFMVSQIKYKCFQKFIENKYLHYVPICLINILEDVFSLVYLFILIVVSIIIIIIIIIIMKATSTTTFSEGIT
jgi:hypothetical protein